jgi:long-chain acyl-CoA synthetase
MKREYTFRPVRLPITETVPQRIRSTSEKYKDCAVQQFKQADGSVGAVSYARFWTDIVSLAVALKDMGVKRGEHVGVISDNRREWLLIDLAILSLGAIDVPRGADTTEDEIAYILNHADCGLVFAENAKMAAKILNRAVALEKLKTLVVIDGDTSLSDVRNKSVTVLSFPEILAGGSRAAQERRLAIDAEIDKGGPDDVATIIYTSGTTGEPKGVILPHRSFIFQVDNVYNYLHVHSYDVAMTVLPVWHSYERAVEYVIIERGLSLVYSRPIGSVLMDDMATFRPTILPAVPRLMEAVMQGVYRNVNKSGGVKKALFNFFISVGGSYAHCRNMMRGWLPALKPRSRLLEALLGFLGTVALFLPKCLGHVLVFKTIHRKFGGRFCMVIVGGGAMPKNVDKFFQAIGITCLEGYGLTETGPILAVRQQHAPVLGTIGPIFKDAQFEVRDESGARLGPGKKGVLFVKSVQNMYGYYKKEEETAKVLSKDGWLNTGDLAMYAYGKVPYMKILGRIKDTIVLSGGKNVEPEPIEQKLNANPLIMQSMVVGQDKKFLCALVIPQQDALSAWAKGRALAFDSYADLLAKKETKDHLAGIVDELISKRNGFKNYERIFKIALIEKPFEPGSEMTQTLKIKRHVVSERYAQVISALFQKE